MAQVSIESLVGIASIVIVINGGALGMLWRCLNKTKDSVQYKDNCAEIVKRQDERHTEIREDLKEIKELIRNGNNPPPVRVRT